MVSLSYITNDSVSILTDFEDIEDPYDWTLGLHGIQIHFMHNGRGKGATFLPDVATEQGWNKEETLGHLFRKAGFSGDWRVMSVDVQRYQSTKAAVTYSEYLDYIKQ